MLDPRRGCDYSHARPTQAQLDRDQLAYCVRYIINAARDRGKRLTLPEAVKLTSWGRKLVCNFEYQVGRMASGFAAGVADARTSLAEMRYLGVPKGRPCYFSDDTGNTPGSAVVAYLRGAASVMGPAGYGTGVYGGLNTISAAYNAGFRWLWQTYAWSTRGGVLVWHPSTTLRQVRNGAFADWDGDLDTAQADDFGQWDTTGWTPAASEEDDMTPDEHKWLYDTMNRVDDLYNRRMGALEGQAKALVTAAGAEVQRDAAEAARDAELLAKAAEIQAALAAVPGVDPDEWAERVAVVLASHMPPGTDTKALLDALSARLAA